MERHLTLRDDSSSAPLQGLSHPSASSKSLATHACSFCQKRKLKCDGGSPCANCLKRSLQCFYIARLPGMKRGPKPKKSQNLDTLSVVAEIFSILPDSAACVPSTPSGSVRVFSPKTEIFVVESHAIQRLLHEFSESLQPLFPWYFLPSESTISASWSFLSRSSPPQAVSDCRALCPNLFATQLEAASLFSVCAELLGLPDLAEHFDDISHEFLKTIFFRMEANMDAASLKTASKGIMLLIFRYYINGKTVAASTAANYLLALANQMDESYGSFEDAGITYSLAVKVTSMRISSPKVERWLSHLHEQCRGVTDAYALPVLESRFFCILNRLVYNEGQQIEVETLWHLLEEARRQQRLIRDSVVPASPDTKPSIGLRFYYIWFFLLDCELLLRLGQHEQLNEALRVGTGFLRTLPTSLQASFFGLINYVQSAGSGLLIACAIKDDLEKNCMRRGQRAQYLPEILSESQGAADELIELLERTEPNQGPSEVMEAESSTEELPQLLLGHDGF